MAYLTVQRIDSCCIRTMLLFYVHNILISISGRKRMKSKFRSITVEFLVILFYSLLWLRKEVECVLFFQLSAYLYRTVSYSLLTCIQMCLLHNTYSQRQVHISLLLRFFLRMHGEHNVISGFFFTFSFSFIELI